MNLLELVMIVKNSGDVLRDCLRLNKKFIDHWTILDTGSSDNTKNIIKEELKDLPGTLYEEDFVDFSTTRNRSLELSSKKCKYTIILDDSYVLYGGDILRKILSAGDVDCYKIKIGHYQNGFLQNEYYSKRIFKTSEMYRYRYRVHEDLVVPENKITKEITTEDIFINDIVSLDHQNRSFSRYKKDIYYLSLDYQDNKFDPKTIYYLARTYYNINKKQESLKFYLELEDLCDFSIRKINKTNKYKDAISVFTEYKFASTYEGCCLLYAIDGDNEKFEKKLKLLVRNYKDRAEPLYKIALNYKYQNKIKEADEILNELIKFKKPRVSFTFIENDLYEYNIPYLYIEIKLIQNQVDKAVEVLKKLLNFYPLDQQLLNIKYAVTDMNISSTKLSNERTIVIHTGNFLACWNPKNDDRISGSEYMAMNMAKEFYNLGYRVFVIGKFENDINNFQGIYDNVEYIDNKYFSEFALKYVIDYLIVSRYTCNLLYYDNIKNVYLWVHDVLPIMNSTSTSKNFQTHLTKFKKIITVSEWQKNNIKKEFGLPQEMFYSSRNAIYPDRFLNKNIEKTPYRFIYSSCPTRGLNYLIDIIPQVKEKYPETTLQLFVNKNLIDYDTLIKIEKLDYVILNKRVSQAELAIEFLKSDVWLYPTDFEETFCITALEAMMAKCLVVTVDFAGLSETVKGRGIVCKHPIDKNIDDLVKKLFFVLEKPYLKEHFIEKSYEWALQQTYQSLATDWVKNLF